MTESQKHAAHLRWLIEHCTREDEAALLAGAEALEAQGRWRASQIGDQAYLVPVDRWADWAAWCKDREPGEYTAIVPDWAVPVPDDVVITGWERP